MIAQTPILTPAVSLISSKNGLSEVAYFIEKRIEKCWEHFDKSIAIAGSQQDTLNEIDEVFRECKEPNWDGYHALPIAVETYEAACCFVRVLQSNLLPSDVSAEPDGEISLEWFRGPKRVFSLSVGPKHRVSFAGIDGSDEWYGASTFHDKIPNRVFESIQGIVGE